MQPRSITSYYLLRLRRLAARPQQLAGFAVASVLHAAGHAMVALIAAAIALCLAERFGLRALPFTSALPSGATGGPEDRALALALVGLAVVVVKGTAGAYATFVQARLAGEVGSALRLELLDAMLAVHRLRRPRHGDHAPAPLTQVAPSVLSLTDRVRDVEAGLEQGVLGGVRAVAQLVPIAALLVALSPRMAATAAIALGAFGWALGRARAGYRRATQRATVDRERLLAAADEAVRHADLWITYGAEAKARAAAKALGAAIARGSARLQARGVALSGGNEVLGAAALLAAMGAARAGWLGRVAGGETLLAFAVAFFLAYRPLRELADARLALARADGAYAELSRVIGRAAAPAAELRVHDWPRGILELRDLTLSHGTCRPLSLCVAAGSIVAIAGPTGIGKTTLLRTLLGLDRARGGAILFDGASLDDAPAGPAARPFAWVPQDAPLL